MIHNDQRFEQQVRRALDQSVQNLDATTRNRLSAMRIRACAQQPMPRYRPGIGFWLPTAALAASVILAIVITLRPAPPLEPAPIAETDIPLDLLLDEEAQESDSDPDFHVWLDIILAGEDDAHES